MWCSPEARTLFLSSWSTLCGHYNVCCAAYGKIVFSFIMYKHFHFQQNQPYVNHRKHAPHVSVSSTCVPIRFVFHCCSAWLSCRIPFSCYFYDIQFTFVTMLNELVPYVLINITRHYAVQWCAVHEIIMACDGKSENSKTRWHDQIDPKSTNSSTNTRLITLRF